MILWLYNKLLALATPLIERHLHRRMIRGKEDPARINERFGRTSLVRPAGTLIWCHAASVGETMSILPLINRLVQRGAKILLTTGTRTSADLAAQRLPTGAFHQFVPLDVGRWVRAFYVHWQPDMVMFVEAELWPNLLAQARMRHLPAALVNARMSEKAYRNWRRFPSLARAMLQAFDLCLAQDAQSAGRLRDLGGRVVESGNLKFDAPELPDNAPARAVLDAMIGGRTIWLAASTHPGEEEMVARIAQRLAERFPDLLTILVPRHAERGVALAEQFRASGLVIARRSQGDAITASTQIYLADTMGELGLFYRLSPLVFMGGSLVRHGGQNPIEPALLGAAVVTGPHHWNQAEALMALQCPIIADETTLGDQVLEWLANPAAAKIIALGQQSRARSFGTVLGPVLAELEPLLIRAGLHAARA